MYQWEEEDSIEIFRKPSIEDNYLDRALSFTAFVHDHIKSLKNIKIAHFRDVWSGLGVLQEDKHYKVVYEVNALYSMELPYKYPNLPHQTLDKIAILEQKCLEGSDAIIVPSLVLKRKLLSLNIPERKIHLITNGAHIPKGSYERPTEITQPYFMYFGALQAWQGVEDLLIAFASVCKEYPEWRLVICSSHKLKYAKNLFRLQERLSLSDKIIWKERLDKHSLMQWLKHAYATVAPLRACSRNLHQGCSPLKIFESLAAGIPVIASNLEVVREIVKDQVHGVLFRADRPETLSRSMKILIENPTKREQFSKAALAHIQENFTWDLKRKSLEELYLNLVKN